MSKDVKIALGIGFLFGVVSAVVAVSFPQLISKISTKDNQMMTASPTVEITPQLAQTDLTIDVEYPKDGEIVDEKTIELRGKTKSDHSVVIDTQDETQIVEPAEDGTFTGSIDIWEGANNIYITSYDENGDSETKTITVLKTNEKL